MADCGEALEVTRPTSACATILDLPTEILHSIFDLHWEHIDATKDYVVDWSLLDDLGKVNWSFIDRRLVREKGLQVIQNLRLVCRRFNQIASPILFPVILVDISQKALDRLDSLSRNPLFAGGVRGVQVNLPYYIPELANSLPLFKETCCRVLGRVSSDADYYAESYFFRGTWAKDDTDDAREYRTLLDLMEDCFVIRSAWNDLVDEPSENAGEELSEGDATASQAGSDASESEPEEDDSEYIPQAKVSASEFQQLLLKAFDQYGKAFEEQSRLLSDGVFVKKVAAAMARMPRSVCLCFGDDFPAEKSTYRLFEEKKSILDYPDRFLRQLTAPSRWSAVERTMPNQGPELLPVRILSDLPIALHQTGASLRELSLGCFPQQSNFHLLRPSQSLCADVDPWDALVDACSNLESFHFGRGGGDNLNSLSVRHEHISGDDKTNVERYLGAMLASQHLEEVNLAMRPFSLNHGYGTRESEDDWLDVSSIIGTQTWRNLRRLSMSQVRVNQETILSIMEGLGHRIRYVWLCCLHLRSGDWLPAIDILRTKVAASLQSGGGGVKILLRDAFKGGDFSRLASRLNPGPESVPASWQHLPKRERKKRKAALLEANLEQLSDYILGIGAKEVLPLLGMKSST